MSNQVVSAPVPLAPPTRTGPLRRARLPFRTGMPLAGGLTVARAPIGYGKSSLLRQWHGDARAAGHPVGWISLNAAHRTVDGLAQGLASAFDGRWPPREPARPITPTDRLAEWLCADSASGTVLFLDNWDAIIDAESEHLLAEFLESGHLRASLYIAGRRRCGLPLEAALANDSLRIIEQHALKLSEAEQQRLLGSRLWTKIPPQMLDACDGWPLALKLLTSVEALDFTTPPDASLFVRQSGLESVIWRQFERACSPAERDFLTWLGFGSNGDVALLNRFREASDSEDLLEGVASLLPFTVSSQRRGLIYRPSELVRPLLKRRFDASPHDQQRHIAQRVFEESYRDGRTLDAINGALLAGQADKALELVESVGPLRLMITYGIQPVQDALGRFPPDMLEHSLRSRLAFPFLYAKRGHFVEAREMIDWMVGELEASHDDDTAKSAAMLDAIFIKTKISACRDRNWIDDQEIAARAKCSREPTFAAWNMIFSGMLNQHLGHLDQADSDFEEAEFFFKQIAADYQLLHMKVHRTHVDLARGNLRHAARAMREIKSTINAHYPSDTGVYAAAELGRIEASLLQSPDSVQIDTVERALGSLEHADSWFELLASAYTSLCRCIARDQGIAALMDALDEAERTLRRHGTSHVNGMIRVLKAYYLAREGHFRKAEHWVDLHAWKIDRDNSEFWRERHMKGLAHSQILAAHGDTCRALQVAETLVRESREDGRQPALVEAQLNQAELLFSLQRHEDQAIGLINEALDLARQIGAYGCLPPWRDLILGHRHAVRDRLDPRLAEPFDRLCNEWQGRVGAGLLTSREIAVLKNVAQGQTNKQISRVLQVSENTVKFHLKQCFRKLNAQHRGDAVRRATDAQLI